MDELVVDNPFEEDLEASNDLVDRKLAKKTKDLYSSKINKFKNYLVEKSGNQYVIDDKISLPLPVNVLKAFLGYISSTTTSPSTLNGHISAIKNLYKENNSVLDFESSNGCKNILCGKKRKYKDQQQAGELPLHEGKKELQFNNYIDIINVDLKDSKGNKNQIFGHCYLKLQWNLMARSNNVALLKYEHITWINDALVITLPKHKGDQVLLILILLYIINNHYLIQI